MTNISVPVGYCPLVVVPPKHKRKKFPFQGFVDFQGLQIDIENKKGTVRRGKGKDGKAWATYTHFPYGEIRNTEGVDGDKLDCYVGSNANSPLVVVVHQQDPETRKYDEDKVMLGFDSLEDALAGYRKQYDRPGYYQSHTKMNIGQFWRWVRDEKKHGKKVKTASQILRLTGLRELARQVFIKQASNVHFGPSDKKRASELKIASGNFPGHGKLPPPPDDARVSEGVYDGDEWIGFVELTYPYSSGSDKSTAHVGVGLLPEYRGRGLAENLVRDFMSRHKDVKNWKWSYVPTNTASERLGKRLGFGNYRKGHMMDTLEKFAILRRR